MVNREHLDILNQGKEVWNEWRRQNESQIKADLNGAKLSDAYPDRDYLTMADFSEANITWIDLHNADLSGANLSGADLSDADLCNANLSDADLCNANLSDADLIDADLYNANLSGANLIGADLTDADLHNTDLSGANLHNANLHNANLHNANLLDADLMYANLIETNCENANFTDCRIYGISAWNLKLQGAVQSDLIITLDNEPTITVDNLEVAQFIYLLLNNEKIREVIDTISRKVVLILGRFTPERKATLDAIRNELRNHDYLPVLFDFEKPTNRDMTETVRTLAHLSRFIIADITEPRSIPQELQSIVPHLAIPVQPLLLEGCTGEYAMFQDLSKYQWVLPIHQYKDINYLLDSLGEKVIAPAESKAQELEKR